MNDSLHPTEPKGPLPGVMGVGFDHRLLPTIESRPPFGARHRNRAAQEDEP